MELTKGQAEIRDFLTKKKKNTTRSIDILNMGQRYKTPVKQVVQEEEVENSKNEETSNRKNTVVVSDYEDEDYMRHQYPEGDEKYKILEERLAAMEV